MMTRHPIIAALSLALSTGLSAQSFTNGSLTGAITTDGVPSGWTKLLESPDVMDQNNNAGLPNLVGFGATPSASPNGGTWVGLGRDGSFIERFGQTVTGFSIGQSYTVSWFVSNFGAPDLGYLRSNQIELLVNGVSVGAGAMRTMSTGWDAQSLSFVATATTHDIAFQLGSANKAYLGIDGISLIAPTTTVPEPATVALLGVGVALLAVVARRQRIS
jgi:hypothetical protein